MHVLSISTLLTLYPSHALVEIILCILLLQLGYCRIWTFFEVCILIHIKFCLSKTSPDHDLQNINIFIVLLPSSLLARL